MENWLLAVIAAFDALMGEAYLAATRRLTAEVICKIRLTAEAPARVAGH
jgi:hypothetical protein